MTPEEQFLARLELVERVIESICRRNRCYGADAEDFGSKVKLKLIDNDYAVFRKFQGKSLLTTYLTTVIANLFRDDRIRKWGKWRPSAVATRMGEVAILLDQLLHRDGFTFDEAVAKLQTDFCVSLSSGELLAIAVKLPPRAPRRTVESDEQLHVVATDDEVDQHLFDRDRADALKKAESGLARALAQLSAEDRLIIKLQFDGFKISKIAQLLKLPQRSLYSRSAKSLRRLRRSLEAAGLTREEVLEIVDWEGFELRVDYDLDDEDSEKEQRKKDGDGDEKSKKGPSKPGGGL